MLDADVLRVHDGRERRRLLLLMNDPAALALSHRLQRREHARRHALVGADMREGKMPQATAHKAPFKRADQRGQMVLPRVVVEASQQTGVAHEDA